MRRILWGVTGLITMAFLAIGAVRFWLRMGMPPLRGRETVSGLDDSVVVLWDSLAVPHISAGSEDDLFTALGYLHARDRLWQMDLLRHAAEGRLSELFGARAIPTDRTLRVLELGRLARARAGVARPDTRRTLEAYARGVNGWIARGSRALEFRLLRHVPETWRPEHSAEVGSLQAWDLRTTGDELELAAAAARLGPDKATALTPKYPDTAPTIVPQGSWRGRRGARLLSSQAEARARPARCLTTAPCGAHPSGWESIDPPARDRRAAASNSWVLGPRRTASRKPILANDPHLHLRAPSIWYLAGVHAPGHEVVGGTIPGIPGVVLGHNRHLAWGFTNAMVDDVDYFVEQLSPDSTRYRTPSGWADVEVVAETIRVRNQAALVYRRLRTADGPLIERGTHAGSGPPLALRWVAQDATDGIGAVLGIGRATGWTSFAAAVEGLRSPEQNVVYADAAGNIGYFLAGHVPVRGGGRHARPTPGWTPAGKWERYLMTSELPRMFNPAEGLIVTANNRVIGDEYPFFISQQWELPYRAERILEMLRSDSAATARSVARQQLDVVDGFCRGVAPLAARAALAAARADVARQLSAWDGSMAPERTEPTVVWSWYRELERLVYEGVSPEYRPAEPLHRWLAEGRSPWKELASLERQAMENVLPKAADVPWASVHRTIQVHALGGVPLLGRLIGFNIGPLATGGGNYTVNAASSEQPSAPFESSWGPSLRHVVDFGDVDRAGGFILPAGQSGHPFSPHYRDQTARWLTGELWILPLDLRHVKVLGRLVLVPEGR